MSKGEKYDTHQRIPVHLHNKMIHLAERNQRRIQAEYNACIKFWIEKQTQEHEIDDSGLEAIIRESSRKTEQRLAGLVAKSGMDISMILMGLLQFLEKEFGVDKQNLYQSLREGATSYYNRPVRDKS